MNEQSALKLAEELVGQNNRTPEGDACVCLLQMVRKQYPLRQKSFLPSYWVIKSMDEAGWFCGESTRPDSYSDAIDQGMFIPNDIVNTLRAILKTFPVAADQNAKDPEQVSSESRFTLPKVSGAIVTWNNLEIKKEDLNVHNRGNFYRRYYLWPMRILDNLGEVRFGRTSWRRK